jgi:hypothetical protein
MQNWLVDANYCELNTYADFILLPDHRLQHPHSEAIASVSFPDYFRLILIVGL